MNSRLRSPELRGNYSKRSSVQSVERIVFPMDDRNNKCVFLSELHQGLPQDCFISSRAESRAESGAESVFPAIERQILFRLHSFATLAAMRKGGAE